MGNGNYCGHVDVLIHKSPERERERESVSIDLKSRDSLRVTEDVLGQTS